MKGTAISLGLKSPERHAGPSVWMPAKKNPLKNRETSTVAMLLAAAVPTEKAAKANIVLEVCQLHDQA